MAVITISATQIGPELISGVPQSVELSTNIPSTIFYTLDGTLPTALSSVYLEAIEIPTSGTIRLRALAISGADSGRLDVTFFTDSTELKEPRRSDALNGAGIVVDAYDVEDAQYDGYTLQGGVAIVPARQSDEALSEYEIKLSQTGVAGEGEGLFSPINLPEEQLNRPSAVSFDASSPNNNNIYFDPRSLYIVIDGTKDDQVHDGYKIINNPNIGSRDSTKYWNSKELYESRPYISGGLVRTLYNHQTGVSCSYYYDNNEMRWIKSIQRFDPAEVPKNTGQKRSSGPWVVFKWVHNRGGL